MLRTLLRLARPYQGRLLRGFGWLVVTNALALGLPWILRRAVHALEDRAPARTIALHALAMAVVALLAAGVRTLSRLDILGVSRKVAYDLRNAFLIQLQRLDAGFYDRQRTGDLVSRGAHDIQLVQNFYGPGVMNLLNTGLAYAGTLVLMLRLDARLTGIALLIFPPLLLAINRISRRVYTRSIEVQEQLAAISNRVQENLSGIQQVKTYVQEEREISAFRALGAEFRDRSLRLASLRGLMLAVIGVASGLGTLVVLFVGGRHVVEGRITLGDFVAFQAYLGMLAWPTIALGWILNTFQRGLGAMARIDEVLSRTPDIPPPGPDDPGEPVDGDLEIRDLTFRYGEGADAVPSLRGVSLTIPRGSRVALVGPVGSGKSTLVNLLARVYPAPPGTIFVGGRDLSTIPTARWRRSLGYVPQEAFLFSRTLRRNIALGDPDAGDEAIEEAVTLARLESDLSRFPKGLDTVVGERGFTLSGGQRQRATLARAAVGDPRLLILDDSLSAVDADTERAILEGLRAGIGDRTCLLVTHRPSTLAAVDRIVVLEEGRVVEDGSHEELLARDGAYARLFRRQELEARLDRA